jgi:hypothetical protein
MTGPRFTTLMDSALQKTVLWNRNDLLRLRFDIGKVFVPVPAPVTAPVPVPDPDNN